MAELTTASVAEALYRVTSRIAEAGGDPKDVTIVAVTKGFGQEAVVAALEAGCSDIGENYAQELVAKAPAAGGARLHFLGGIQRNKVSRLASLVGLWQSVDRLEAGQAIARHSPGAEILVQVDLMEGSLAGRSGVALDAVPDLARALTEMGLNVKGLMAIGPPPPADPEPRFRRVAELRDSLGLVELSMGMSDDLEAAVRAGTTMVRIGRALFGDRPKSHSRAIPAD